MNVAKTVNLIFLTILVVFAPAGGSASPVADGYPRERLLFDFEGDLKLSNYFTLPPGSGAIRAARRDAPPSDIPIGAAGKALWLRAGAGQQIWTKNGWMPGDFSNYEEFRFWVWRSPDWGEMSVEVRFYEGDDATRFWRLVELPEPGWSEVVVPLKFMRTSPNRVASWDDVTRFAFFFRTPGEVAIDSIRLVDTMPESGPALTVRDLVPLAFPDRPAGEVRVIERGHVALATDAPALDAERLVDHLNAVAQTFLDELPFVQRPDRPARILVFRNSEEYRAFTPVFAEALNSVAVPPRSEGYTLLGVALAAYDERWGWQRPTFTHEFIHSLMVNCVALPNKSEWFQEAVANHYQLRFHPQENFPQIVMNGISSESNHVPLREVLDGNTIALTSYWQALTVFETMMAKPEYREQLPALVRAFQESGGTDLGPHLGPVLGTTWEQLTEDWMVWNRHRYGGGGDAVAGQSGDDVFTAPCALPVP